MLQCGICKERFLSNDDLRVHLEQHASQLFDSSDEEVEENGNKGEQDSDQDSDEGSLVFDCVKEEEQVQGQSQQEETQDEGSEESSWAPSEAGDERHTLRERESSSEIFMCSKCAFKTINNQQLKEHMNQMHLNKIKCKYCPKRYPSEAYLANHVREKHMKYNVNLPEDEFFRTAKKRSKQKKKIYECLKCTYKTERKYRIYQHIRSVHKNLLDELYKSKGMVLDDAAYQKCPKCSYKTLYKSNLKQHIKTVHQKRRDFVCDLCKKTFFSKSHLIQHMKSIHMKRHPLPEIISSVKAFKCSKCSFKTINNQMLKEHMNQMHLNKIKCKYCPKRFSSKSRLANHIEKEHEDGDNPKLPEDEYFRIAKNQGNPKRRIYECLKCTFKTSYRTVIYRHIRAVHKNFLDELYKSKGMTMDDATYYKCTKCFYKSLQMSNVKHHIKRVHQMRRDFVCDLCKKAFSSKDNIIQHMKNIHISAKSSELHKCSICSYKTIQKINLKKHLNAVHLKIREFTCDLCQKQASKKDDLRQHIERLHLEKKCTPKTRKSSSETFMCSECSYKTKNKQKFKNHMNVVHLNKYKCDHCPKRYPSRGHLANHVREKHMKDEDKPKLPEDEIFRIAKKRNKQNKRLYECLKCTFETPIKSFIYVHIRSVHKNLLDELYKSKGIILDDAAYHKCTECFFKTLRIDGLKQHIMGVHQKRRDFVCDLCKKAFSDKRNLLSHEKKVHISAESSELHKCSICTFKTIYKETLKRHLNVVHLKIRGFTCDLCQKQSSTKNYLQRHIEKHHLEKNILSCNRGSHCSFRATNKHDLLRHIRRAHEKIQGFSCEICGKWYSSRFGLSLHKKTHLTMKILTCDLCQFTTKHKRYMYRHMKRKHLKKKADKK